MLRRLMGTILRFIVVTPARSTTMNELITRLQQNGGTISQTMHAAPDIPKNRKQIAHIVGIERWGLNRMRTAFGEKMGHEEYDAYRPNNGLTTEQMAQAFDETRTETIALAEQIETENKAEAIAPHNDMGDISLKAWLFYLDQHAMRELGRVAVNTD